MRVLLPLLLLSTLSFGQLENKDADLKSKEVEREVTPKQPKCEDIDGLNVTSIDEVSEDYTGVAFICEEGFVKSIANYKDGKRDSVSRVWYENGQLICEKNYKDGKIIDGPVNVFNEDGSMWKIEYHKDGRMVNTEIEPNPGDESGWDESEWDESEEDW